MNTKRFMTSTSTLAERMLRFRYFMTAALGVLLVSAICRCEQPSACWAPDSREKHELLEPDTGDHWHQPLQYPSKPTPLSCTHIQQHDEKDDQTRCQA